MKDGSIHHAQALDTFHPLGKKKQNGVKTNLLSTEGVRECLTQLDSSSNTSNIYDEKILFC